MAPTFTKLAVLALLCASTAARGADYFVNDASTDGDVAFPACATMGTGADAPSCGTCASPCLSPQYLYDQRPLGPGDTVWLNTGRYTTAAVQPILRLGTAEKAGTAQNPLTFRGPADATGRAARGIDGSPLALFDGEERASAGVLIAVNGIRLESLGFARFQDDTTCTRDTMCGSGVRLVQWAPVTWFELRGLDFFGMNGFVENAIDIDQPDVACAHCLIDNAWVHDAPFASQAIYVSGVRGLQLRRSVVERYGNRPDVAAIYFGGVHGSVVANNVVRACGGPAFHGRNCENTCLSQFDDNQIVNNTFRGNQTAGDHANACELRIANANRVVVRDNIIQTTAARALLLTDTVTIAVDFNGYSLGPATALARSAGIDYPTLATWQATGQDDDSLVANPIFVSDLDSHLQSRAGYYDALGMQRFSPNDSPFIDRADPTSSFASERAPHGHRADLGAYGNTPQNSQSPSRLRVVSGDRQTGAAYSDLPLPLVVELLELDDQPAAGVTVRFEVQGSDAMVRASTDTNASGAAQATLVLGTVGEHRVRASVAGVAQTVELTATATMPQADAGMGDVDAGTPDAGVDDVTDAGTMPDPRVASRLALGCGCSAQQVTAVMGLAALWLMRRRSGRGSDFRREKRGEGRD